LTVEDEHGALDDDAVAFLEGALEYGLVRRGQGDDSPELQAGISRAMARLSGRAPRCVLMAAMPGSGKTQLAFALRDQGMVRLCPDEEMFARHGVYGVDFPRGEYRVREDPILDDVAVELADTIAAGFDVVLDQGLWNPQDRARWRNVVDQAGGTSLLVYMPVPHDVRWARISGRNHKAQTDPNAIFFSEEDLTRFEGRFIPPGDDEPHLVYDGDPGQVSAALAMLPRRPHHAEEGPA
jgi:predicted kinase